MSLRAISGWPAELLAFVRQALVAAVRHNHSALAARWRARLYRTECFIDTGVVVVSPANFSAGAGSALYHGCYLLNPHGRVRLGATSHLGAQCYVNACYGTVEIGAGVAIGPGTRIFSYSNHYARGRPVAQEYVTRDVHIGDNVFIGANCTVLPGSVIGFHVVVGAGSVVRGTLAPNAVYGGVPVRQLKAGWYE